MFRHCFKTMLSATIVVMLWTGIASAAGLLVPVNGGPALEIKNHKVNVVIEDGYAITTVEQVFHNPNKLDTEAIYSFPVPEKGAVSEFTFWIDGKPVTGEVFEKKEARKIYEEEKAAGRDAGLTEQDSYKTFDIHVSPVRAGQQTRIRLTYMQPMDVDLGIGRYVYPLEEGGVDEEKLAFWTSNEEVTDSFEFDLSLRSAYPVDAVRLPGHPQASVQRKDAGEWNVSVHSLGQNAAASGDDVPENWVPVAAANPHAQTGTQTAYTLDNDLVVYWRHTPGLTGSVDMVTHRPDPNKPGTFMLVVTPGDDLKPITEGKDWVFVLDISGSMQGKYATLVDGVNRAFKKMRHGDRFRIITFNNSPTELTSGFVPVTPENVAHYGNSMMNIQPNGGTNLYAGLDLGLSRMDSERTGSIVLVTDGVANVGETEQRQFIKLLGKKDVRLFTFVMGNSANRPLLDALAKESNGFALSVSNSDDIVGKLLQATAKVGYEALHGVKLDISGVRTSDVTPSDIGSLYRGQQLVVFGHYNTHGQAKVRLSGRISGKETSYETSFAFPETSSRNPEIERLWAFATIDGLMHKRDIFGEDPDMKQAIVDIATEYGLVTDYTSMLVLSEEQFAVRKVDRRNKVRLAEEQAARQQRAKEQVQSNRVDTSSPMFNTNRAAPSSGGGSEGAGAFGPWSLLLLVPLVAARLRSLRRR